jgi:pimeloyl-ACP methyl ester carboxylesterase
LDRLRRILRSHETHVLRSSAAAICVLAGTFGASESLFTAEYRLYGLRGVGHFVHLEEPEVFAALVLRSLKDR